MIARIWRGRTPAAKAAAHLTHFEATGLVEYTATPGNRGVRFLQRIEDDVAEFLVITLWDSLDDIRAFAGDEIERAVYYPGDDEFLLEREPTVAHYEVLVDR